MCRAERLLHAARPSAVIKTNSASKKYKIRSVYAFLFVSPHKMSFNFILKRVRFHIKGGKSPKRGIFNGGGRLFIFTVNTDASFELMLPTLDKTYIDYSESLSQVSFTFIYLL